MLAADQVEFSGISRKVACGSHSSNWRNRRWPKPVNTTKQHCNTMPADALAPFQAMSSTVMALTLYSSMRKGFILILSADRKWKCIFHVSSNPTRTWRINSLTPGVWGHRTEAGNDLLPESWWHQAIIWTIKELTNVQVYSIITEVMWHSYEVMMSKGYLKRDASSIKHQNYRQNSNISHTLVGNKIVDHSDVVGALPCRCCSNYIFVLDWTPGFNALGGDNLKMRRESFKFWNLVQLILDILQ